ncbi:MAG TPA: carboxypeptidase regulatory-like domain-containing protein [Thermoanaerobaculia bacterium]|nr:carboxypeptidase regulatory-like domain-containing protein [Thermoanaerobaculia bacterium]
MRLLVRCFIALAIISLAGSLSAELRLGNDSLRSTIRSVGPAWFFRNDEDATLWRTDGTAAGTWALTSVEEGHVPDAQAAFGGKLYFVQSRRYPQYSLRATNGTVEGTHHVLDLPEGPVDHIAASNSLLFVFLQKDWNPSTTLSLIRTDGTGADTQLLADFPSEYGILHSYSMGNLLFFTNSKRDAYELWRSDGTVAGTFKLAENRYGIPWLASAVTVGGKLFFEMGIKVWMSDGTIAGTSPLTPQSSNLFGAIGDAAYINSNYELFRIDSTGKATSVRKFSVPTFGRSDGERLFLFAYTQPYSLTIREGTQEKTVALPALPELREHVSMGGVTYFPMKMESGDELWRSDGTPEGTMLLKDIAPGQRDAQPAQFVRIGDRVLFSANDGIHGREPWITDGTTEGTRMVRNIAREMILTGMVTDAATGEPLRDAVVTLWGPPFCSGCSVEQRDFPVEADGRFTIEGMPSGKHWLSARSRSNRFIPQTWPGRDCVACDVTASLPIIGTPGVTQDGFDFALKRSGVISGHVLDAHGGPVAGVEVRVTKRYDATPLMRTISRADGSWETMEPLPENESFLIHTTDAAGYSGVIYPAISCSAGCSIQSGGVRVRVRAGETRSGIDFTVRPWGKIEGRIIDRVSGRPAAIGTEGLRLTTFPAHPAFPILISGNTFSVSLPDGQFRLLFRPTNADALYRPAWFPGLPCSTPTCSTPLGYAVTGIPGTTIRGQDVALEPIGGRIEGHITDAETGAPVAAIDVRILNNGGLGSDRTMTDSNGYYTSTARLPLSSYSVQTTARPPWFPATYGGGDQPCRPFACAGTSVDIVDNSIRSGIDFSIHRYASVRGVIADAKNGQLLARVHVELRNEDPAGDSVEVESDATGQFTASGLRPGSYTLTATSAGWNTAGQIVNIAHYGSETNVLLAMEPSCEVTITRHEIVVPAIGITATIPIADGCTRCAFSPTPFIRMRSSCSNGAIEYTVETNTTNHSREGVIVLPGETIVVKQR